MFPEKRLYQNEDVINPTAGSNTTTPITRKRYAANAHRLIQKNVKSFRSTLRPIFENCFRCQDNENPDGNDSEDENKKQDNRLSDDDSTSDEAAGSQWSY